MAKLCAAKSEAFALHVLGATMEGAVVGVIVVVVSNADAGVRSAVDDEVVPLVFSLDVGILAGRGKLAVWWRRHRLLNLIERKGIN